MKKLLLLLGVGLLFQTCSSDYPIIDEPTNNPQAKLYDVTFDLRDFDVTIRSTTVSSNDRYLKYRVYYRDTLNTAKNLELIAKEGMLTPAKFNGTISLKLPQGAYTIIVFSSDKAIGNYIDLRSPSSSEPSNYSNTGIPYNDLTQDLFNGVADFRVGETSVLKTIEMGRRICKINLALDLFSKIPTNVQSLAVMVNFTPVGFSLDSYSQFLASEEYIENQVIVANGTPNTNNPYFKMAIPKDQIANYGQKNPFSFYYPDNQARWKSDGSISGPPQPDYRLCLIGFDKDVRVSETAKVVYKKLIHSSLQSVSGLSFLIYDSVLDEKVTVSINDEWSDSEEINF